jgi:hypothetical protein
MVRRETLLVCQLLNKVGPLDSGRHEHADAANHQLGKGGKKPTAISDFDHDPTASRTTSLASIQLKHKVQKR